MIEDTSLQVKQIADTYIKDPVVRSQYLEDMKYNMKADTGIPEYLSDEALSEEMNLQYDEDVLAGTEKALTKVPVTEETVKNMMSNMYTYTLLEKSYPSTAVVQSWTDKDLAQKMLSDDVFLINATNTEQDYPIYMTRSNIFNSYLLDAMDKDSPSIYSYMRRIGTPVGLAVGFNLMKSALGTFLAHGVSAAYDTVMIGDTIYNTQKKYNDRMYQLIADRTMTLEEYQKACEELFNDINANVPEEYRYDIYKGLYEGPDPFADMGLSFSGAALEANFNAIKTTIRGTLGASRKALKAVRPITNKEAVTHTEYNEELVQHINDWLTNKVDEDAVDEIVESKNIATKPADVTPEAEDVAKGLMKNKEIDDNLLQNSSNDRVLPALSSFGIRRSVPDAPDTIKSIMNNESAKSSVDRIDRKGESNFDATTDRQVIPDTFWQQTRFALSDTGRRLGLKAPLGEIKFSENRYSYFIDHGKGVDNLPMTYEEAARLIKQLSGRKGLPEISTPNINTESDYVAISTASKVPWGPEEIPAKAKHLPRTGEGTEMYGSGIYASFVDDNEASRALYYKNFKKELENKYIKTAKDKNIYAVDNPYFWYKNAQSTLTKKEKAIIDDIANSYNKDLLDYDAFDDAYKGIDFNTQLVASEGTLKSNLDFVKGSLEEAIKEYEKDPSSAVAQGYLELIAERNMLENIIKHRKKYPLQEARLYTHSIKNPNKYPEKYLRFYVTGNDKRVGKIIPELTFHNTNAERLKEQEEWIRYVFEKAVEKKNEEYWKASNPFMQQKIDDDLDKFNEALRGKDYDIDTWYSALKSAYSDYRDIGIDGLIHSDTNIVIFNKDAVMPVNKLEKGIIRKSVDDVHTQIGYDNAHMIVEADDGVGYFVRELHGVKGAKPMIIKNGKVVDFGDYKPYNSKK